MFKSLLYKEMLIQKISVQKAALIVIAILPLLIIYFTKGQESLLALDILCFILPLSFCTLLAAAFAEDAVWIEVRTKMMDKLLSMGISIKKIIIAKVLIASLVPFLVGLLMALLFYMVLVYLDVSWQFFQMSPIFIILLFGSSVLSVLVSFSLSLFIARSQVAPLIKAIASISAVVMPCYIIFIIFGDFSILSQITCIFISFICSTLLFRVVKENIHRLFCLIY